MRVPEGLVVEVRLFAFFDLVYCCYAQSTDPFSPRLYSTLSYEEAMIIEPLWMAPAAVVSAIVSSSGLNHVGCSKTRGSRAFF
jgi:hypothetical protein